MSTMQSKCWYCYGTGKEHCSRCFGTGILWKRYQINMIFFKLPAKRRKKCSACNGTGKKTCFYCNGTGKHNY